MLKVLYASNSTIPSLTANSMHVMKMCQALAQNGAQVELAALSGGRAAVGILEEQYGVKMSFSPYFYRSLAFFQHYDFALRASWRAWLSGVDLVVTRHLPVAFFCAHLGLPVCLEMHGPRIGRLKKVLFQSLLSHRNLKKFVTISQPLAEEFRALAGNKKEELEKRLLILADAVDLERFENLPTAAEAKTSLGLPPERFTLGYAGHLYEGRGINIIVGLAKLHPDCEFFVVGGEPVHIAHWREEVKKLGIGNLKFFGFVSNRSLPLYLAAADALLMPYQKRVAVSAGGDTSKWMSPLKMFEYMAVGRPVLASDLPVLKEVLTEENVLFCEPEQVSSWSAGLQKIRSEKEFADRLAAKCLRDVQKYTWRIRAERILQESLVHAL